ncbi:MAG: ABC transporter ATP-binding protein [Bacteroidia bacterium]|jgi:ABC-2 type transport system ATP-binding protein
METTLAIDIRNLTKRYAAHTALNDVSIEVPQGQIFGLLGPNGAGKTSLIRIINQITAPDSGQVLLFGAPLAPIHISRIGYLPEERGLYRKMNVGEQALYLARLKGLSTAEAKSRLKMWFERFDLNPWWNKKVEELSKGMQQKVQFIVTVLHEPDVLILDEPFSGFDPVNAALIRDEILRLRDSGTTILLSTHRMESVEALCHSIALLHKSKVYLSGSLTDIKNRFRKNEYRVVLEMPESEFNAQVQTLRQELAPTKLEWASGFTQLEFQLPHTDSLKSTLNGLLKLGNLVEFRELLPGMDRIFVETVTDLPNA